MKSLETLLGWLKLSQHLWGYHRLRPCLPELFPEAYPGGVNWAIAETGLPESLFPSESPWTLDDALDDSFWPE